MVFLQFSVCMQATEEDGSSDDDMGDEAMMELDKSLSALFSEQKKKTEAKKDEKRKKHKEKVLLRDFRIKVTSVCPPVRTLSRPDVDFPAASSSVCVVGVGPGGGFCGPAGWQPSCSGFGGTSAPHH